MTTIHPYTVPIVAGDLRRAEFIKQYADTFDYLDAISQDMFNRIAIRLNIYRAQLNKFDERIQHANAHIDRIKGSKRAIQVHSSARYPVEQNRSTYKSIFECDTDNEDNKTPALHYNLFRLNETTDKFIDLKDKESKSNDDTLIVLKQYEDNFIQKTKKLILNGLGRPPTNINSVVSFLKYNTQENPYTQPTKIDPLNVGGRIRKQNDESAQPRNTNHQSYRHYSSSCSQTNTLSLLSSPSSPISIPLKSSSQLTNCNTPEDMAKPLNNSPSKIISLLPSNDHLQTICNSLSAPVDSKYSSCSTMITPTATLISSSTTSSSDHCSGQQLNSVQWTKLSCPPPPPTTSSSSSIATTTNNSLEPLETTYVVNIVRKLLEQHNIGQCIFARHVLSLSQGTVSELLSKPQAWSKLTEKGKESYRKMWSWTNSEESILALKSLSPRKVLSDEPKRSRTPSSSSTSSREHSPINQQSFISSSMFSTFPPSLLMQTTNRLKNDIYSPYNILYPQPENNRNWLMLQEIVRTNAMIKQFKSTDVDENEQENEDDTDENPLDLSMKIDTDQTVINNKQSTIKQNKTILIPLTEQDMMKYRHINTIELVQTINDILSR
ncbi:unnamed protein product [Rotaria sp. Silwood2]|nr:unnamed protein product [Rotaria sp. Silwood2]